MKKLPVGIQSFSNLREEGYLYVDKTADIHRIITDGRIYFLSRPRRFGKSLLISTMAELFRGNKKLFEGLYIYDKWDWTQSYPVIRIDWTNVRHSSKEEMERSMSFYLKLQAENYGVQLFSEYADECFRELIIKLNQTTGQKVAVLIDEYDVPILDAIGKPEMTGIREFLQVFYRLLKASDDYLKFIFLTGISKFSKVSIFSALNSMDDITMNKKYASLCGYTQQELEYYFAEYLDDTARENGMTVEAVLDGIRRWYDGYSWDGKTFVYNPFSTLLFFENKEFSNYWFATGTPTFLIELFKKRNDLSVLLQPVHTGSRAFDSWDPDLITEIPLLFQTGYLTVKERKTVDMEPEYTLEMPNREVALSMQEHLLFAYASYPLESASRLRRTVQQQILLNDAKGVEKSLRQMLARVPYQIDGKTEAYYHSIFLIWMSMLGFDIQGEISTNYGRIDAVWEQAGTVVVAELKYGAGKQAETLLNEAITQIHDRKYYERYLDREVKLLGIAFNGEEAACRIDIIARD
ncbi:MAG: ATP-binding protein [Tannerella sp.]|jgi:Holliday junction resolvase-like predicted endonuclease|nr:ATP-binding protein [Tannerella sp.]